MSIISIRDISRKFDIPVRGIIQVADGGELDEFVEAGAARIHLIEANEVLIEKLQTRAKNCRRGRRPGGDLRSRRRGRFFT